MYKNTRVFQDLWAGNFRVDVPCLRISRGVKTDTHLISPCKNVTNQDLAYLNYRHMLGSGGVRVSGRVAVILRYTFKITSFLPSNQQRVAGISFSLFLLFNDASSRQSQDQTSDLSFVESGVLYRSSETVSNRLVSSSTRVCLLPSVLSTSASSQSLTSLVTDASTYLIHLGLRLYIPRHSTSHIYQQKYGSRFCGKPQL
jgi:hypothetical protein